MFVGKNLQMTQGKPQALIHFLCSDMYFDGLKGVFRIQSNISQMELSAKIVNGFQLFTISQTTFILDV